MLCLFIYLIALRTLLSAQIALRELGALMRQADLPCIPERMTLSVALAPSCGVHALPSDQVPEGVTLPSCEQPHSCHLAQAYQFPGNTSSVYDALVL